MWGGGDYKLFSIVLLTSILTLFISTNSFAGTGGEALNEGLQSVMDFISGNFARISVAIGLAFACVHLLKDGSWGKLAAVIFAGVAFNCIPGFVEKFITATLIF